MFHTHVAFAHALRHYGDDHTYSSDAVVIVAAASAGGSPLSLSREYLYYARTWMSAYVAAASAHTYTLAHSLARAYTPAADASRRYLSGLLLQQMPVATRPGRRCHVFGFASRTSAWLCSPSYPSSLPPVFPPAVLLTEKRFSPFLPRDRALTLSRHGSGVESTRRSDDEATALFLPLSFFSPVSLLFFLRKTILSNQRSDNNRDLGINGTNR